MVTVKHSAFPRMRVLGQVQGTVVFRDVANYRNAIVFDDVAVVRFDAELYFANSGTERPLSGPLAGVRLCAVLLFLALPSGVRCREATLVSSQRTCTSHMPPPPPPPTLFFFASIDTRPLPICFVGEGS